MRWIEKFCENNLGSLSPFQFTHSNFFTNANQNFFHFFNYDFGVSGNKTVHFGKHQHTPFNTAVLSHLYFYSHLILLVFLFSFSFIVFHKIKIQSVAFFTKLTRASSCTRRLVHCDCNYLTANNFFLLNNPIGTCNWKSCQSFF